MSTLVTRPATITDGDAAVDVVEDAVEQAGPAPVSTEVVLAAALLVVAVAPILNRSVYYGLGPGPGSRLATRQFVIPPGKMPPPVTLPAAVLPPAAPSTGSRP